MKILEYFVIAIECLVGVLSTLAIVVSLVGTIAYKIYRKVKFGASMYD